MKFALLLLIFNSILSGQEPSWLDSKQRSAAYPKEEYYQGFVTRNYFEHENLAEVENEVLTRARVRLSESIYVSITSKASNTISNTNTNTLERFEKKSVTKTQLTASGLGSETYFNERKKIVFGFVYIKKRKLLSNYRKEYEYLLESIGKRLNANDKPSLSDLVAIETDLDQAESLQNMIRFLGISFDFVLKQDELLQYRKKSAQLTDELRNSETMSLKDAAEVIVDGLMSRLDLSEIASMKIDKTTFKDTGIATELSVYMNNYLSEFVSEKVKVSNADNGWLLEGSYWPTNDKIKFMMSVHETYDDEIVNLAAKTSVSANKALVDSLQVSYVPFAKKKEKIATHDVITKGDPSGEMDVQLSTQKGTSSLVFQEGEELKLRVKVSRPSYIQLINIWADGSQLLLHDNFFVDATMVNRYVELPFTWETACPCGVEYISARASNRPNPKLQIESKDGFDFIVAPIVEILEKQRGFTRKEQSDYTGEASLIVSTLPGN